MSVWSSWLTTLCKAIIVASTRPSQTILKYCACSLTHRTGAHSRPACSDNFLIVELCGRHVGRQNTTCWPQTARWLRFTLAALPNACSLVWLYAVHSYEPPADLSCSGQRAALLFGGSQTLPWRTVPESPGAGVLTCASPSLACNTHVHVPSCLHVVVPAGHCVEPPVR